MFCEAIFHSWGRDRTRLMRYRAATRPSKFIVDGYAARHRVPPGVTGWAQIHGWRGEIDDPAKLKARFEHDLYYIENRSMALDLYVLAMTPLRLLNTRNAY